MSRAWIDLAYLIAAVLFILGLIGLTRPRTAVRGNLMGAVGMLIAVVVTLFDQQILSYWAIVLGLLIGSGIGAALALKVKIERLPEMVVFTAWTGAGVATPPPSAW